MLSADEPDRSCRIVELLRRHSTFPHPCGNVQLIETHISWLFVTDKLVYKLKKPVRLEFLDFTTPELRRQACEEEVRLNRRLSYNVYLGIIPITCNAHGELGLGGADKAVDWVVQMRRLPENKALDYLLRTGQLKAADESAIGRHLVAFFTSLTPQSIEPDNYRLGLEKHILANKKDLSNGIPTCERIRLSRIVGNQLRYLHVAAPCFDARVAAGRIVDGHGDLRPEHIYAETPPSIIDCIEFSAEFRCNDVADELSFLAMECDRIGHSEVGNRFLTAFTTATGDTPSATLLAFYKSYRAVVRAKVACLRLQQAITELRPPIARQVHQYLTWADHYAAQLGRPSFIFVGGLMGTGKSTVAKDLSMRTGAELLATDSIRRTMFGASSTPAGYGEQVYSPQKRSRVYEELFKQAAAALDRGLSVVLDGTFLSAEQRKQAILLSHQHGAVPLFVHCHCPKSTALSRIATRAAAGTSDSEARIDLYDRQRAEFETIGLELPSVHIDTTRQLVHQSRAVFHALRGLLGQ